MAWWALTCNKCGNDFRYAEIESGAPELPLLAEGWIDKPPFPEGGKELECPHCHDTSLYQVFMLRYEKDKPGRTGRAARR